MHSPVVVQIRAQDHDARVEGIWPAAVRCGSEGGIEVEELVRCSQRHHVGVQVDDPAKLRLAPEGNFGEGKGKVGAA